MIGWLRHELPAQQWILHSGFGHSNPGGAHRSLLMASGGPLQGKSVQSLFVDHERDLYHVGARQECLYARRIGMSVYS